MGNDIAVVIETLKDTDESISFSVADACLKMMQIYCTDNYLGLNKIIKEYSEWWAKDNLAYINPEDARLDTLELFDFFAFIADKQIMKLSGRIPESSKKNDWELYKSVSEYTYGPIRQYYRDTMNYKPFGDTWTFSNLKLDANLARKISRDDIHTN